MSASGLEFILFTVLPVAFRELLRWLYEWQILICGVLALVAARVWGRSVVRAARITARAKQQPPAEIRRPAAEPVVVPTPLAAGAEPVVTVPVAPGNEPAVKEPPKTPDLPERLFSLREQIRNTLGRMPCTDEVLSAERLSDCRAIADFPLGEAPSAASRAQVARFEALKSKLAALKDVRDSDTCRNAWEALVRISMDARDLMGEEPAKAAGHSS
jgi:hypothetical protein